MSWRVHVPEGTIRRLDILSGKPSLLAAWLTASHVLYYDLQTGQKHSEAHIAPADVRERTAPTWKPFLDATEAPNHIHLPYLRARNGGVYSSSDGTRRVIALGPRELLFLAHDEEARMALDDATGEDTVPDAPIVALGIDRSGGGNCAVLDALGRLTLFRDAHRVGTWPVPLTLDGEMRPMLVVGRGSVTALICDGRRLIAVDGSGKVRAEADLHFTVGAMAGSNDGKKLVLTDLDGNILRVYTGALVATHQRFAVDLLAEARRAQIEAIPESGRAALGAIAINSKGVVAFAVASTLCVTSLTRLSVIPHPTV